MQLSKESTIFDKTAPPESLLRSHAASRIRKRDISALLFSDVRIVPRRSHPHFEIRIELRSNLPRARERLHHTQRRHHRPFTNHSLQTWYARFRYTTITPSDILTCAWQSSGKVKSTQIWGKNKDELKKQLDELKQELVQLRTQKIAGGAQSKLNKMCVPPDLEYQVPIPPVNHQTRKLMIRESPR